MARMRTLALPTMHAMTPCCGTFASVCAKKLMAQDFENYDVTSLDYDKSKLRFPAY